MNSSLCLRASVRTERKNEQTDERADGKSALRKVVSIIPVRFSISVSHGATETRRRLGSRAGSQNASPGQSLIARLYGLTPRKSMG